MASTRRFVPHLICSATGAANDNLFKTVFTVGLAGWAMRHDYGADSQRVSGLLTQLAGLTFLIPFALFAPIAGSLGDRIARDRIARWVRWIEVALVLLGTVAFATDRIDLIFATIAGLAIQSAFFAPVKLALVPDLVGNERAGLSNSRLQAITIVAILAGTGLAGVSGADGLFGIPPHIALLIAGMSLALVGAVSSFGYPKLEAANPQMPLKPFALLTPLRALGSAPRLLQPSLALGGFWGLGAAAQIQVLSTGEHIFGLDAGGCALLALCLAVGIIIGALLAPRWDSRAFPAGLPLLGAVIAATSLAIAGSQAAVGQITAKTFGGFLVVAGIGAGLWEVPLQNLLLRRAPAEVRNQVMAGSGMIGTFAMLATIGLCMILTGVANLSSPAVLATLAWCTLAIAGLVGLYFRHQVGAWALTRFVRLIYRVHPSGMDAIPASGGCVVVCNHLSFADGLILGSTLPRPARYMVYSSYLSTPVVGWILRLAGAIPISAEHGRRALAESIEAAVEAARQGEVVVIFPEGKLTRSGQMDTFRSGMERIAGRAGVPVIPAHLHGLWGALSSRSQKRGWNPFRRISLRLGDPLPSDTPAAHARDRVTHLSFEDAYQRNERNGRTLGTALLRQAKRHPSHIAVQDAQGSMTNIQVSAIAQVLWPQLNIKADETRVGILLPPGRAGTLINAACALYGRTTVNLNHTVGPVQLQQLCDLAGIKTIISAGPYLDRIGELGLSTRVVKIESFLKSLSKFAVVCAMIRTFLIPARWLVRSRPNDVAAIIFSSGSTGMPKGVELTHTQILANCDAVADALHLVAGQDVLLTPLPLFHSFGLVPGMWLGLVLGLRIAAQPDPMDGKALGKLAAESKATFLISTPTFVRGYLRRVDKEQFASLRFAVVAAERCDAELKKIFAEKYNADLLEGYGCTELCPAVAFNLPEVKRDGLREVHSRDGSVGRALPGIHVFTVHAETREILPPGSEGLLVVRSAARMRGYLDRPDLTDTAFIHGGYNTGDIGRIDNDGFIFITGRLARFAKIGGEMVPLDNVERAIQEKAGEDCEIAVSTISDPSKGERLIVMTTGEVDQAKAWVADLGDLPALWRPKANDVHHVELVPKLGTGKRDLGGIKKLAETLTGSAKVPT